MINDGIIEPNNTTKVANDHYYEVSEEELKEYEDLKSINVDQE
jgi:hypothetical protein